MAPVFPSSNSTFNRNASDALWEKIPFYRQARD